MPELPEVETMRRGLRDIVGATVLSARRTPCTKKAISIVPRIDALNRRLAGQSIAAVERVGKRVVVVMSDRHHLVFEPRMTGIVLTGEPPNREHLRFEMKLGPPTGSGAGRKSARMLRFWDRRGLGRIELFGANQFEALIASGKLGPDAMKISAEQLMARARVSRRAIKVSLLDQKLVAGIGNLYASEILHVAGVDPRARCDRLSGNQWKRIYSAMREVLEMAIRYEGSTLADGTYQKALGDPGGYQNQHRVYDRADTICLNCQRSKIKRIVQAQRSTFFCPRCQKKH